MTDKYGIIKAKHELPTVDLLRVPHKGKPLIVSTVFGPNTYNTNVQAMQGEFYNSDEFPSVTLREPLTQESISAAAYEFGSMAKPEIFDPRWLQAGRIVRTQDGVFTNTRETDGQALTALLNGAEKVNGIYLINDQMAFAPYESFETGVQEGEEFAQGGLARALEHTPETVAENLKTIASKGFYPSGVNVWGFDKVRKPTSRVVSLGSGWDHGGDWLNVVGNYWVDDDGGCAFGVSASDEVA